MEGNMNVGQGNRTFLSDVIGEDYKNWLQGSAIMIKAPTGLICPLSSRQAKYSK